MLRKLAFAAACFALCVASSHAQVTTPPENRATTNSSATIATGSTFQTVLAASGTASNPRRNSLTIQNNNTNGDNCWIFIGSGSATKGTSILLGQGGSFQRYAPYIPNDVIQATCLSNNDTLYVDTQ